jgi:hypothetical protein
MKYYKVTGTLFVTSLCALTGLAQADTAPAGTLLYNFTYSVTQDISSRDSANPVQEVTEAVGDGAPANPHANPGGPGPTLGLTSGSGTSAYGGRLTDKGTMTVKIVTKRSDGALVVMISEQGENIRRASPAQCIVYGNTNVLCDSHKTVYTEEYTLLRFLAANFVDPTVVDSNRRWQIVQNVNNDHISADYIIDSNNNGAMRIGEKRTIQQTGSGRLTTDIDTKIDYDFTRTLPTSVDEYAQQYTDAGINGSQRTIYQTTLQLVSDTVSKS